MVAAQAVALDLMTLLGAPGVGPSRARKILELWQLAGRARPLLDESLTREALTGPQAAALPQSRERAQRSWDELSAKSVHALSIIDPAYPADLKTSLGERAPLLILCIGNAKLLAAASVGFCGSREATEKGMTTARQSAQMLAHESINIVSGFAAGVDMNAHRAALAAGGTTTIVLAEGILRFRVKREIADEWDDKRTLVVSEFGPNLPWSVGHAMQRNRTICGLSRAMILIEARAEGGSIQAGRECLKIGLPLFAAVYEGMPESATGNQELLRHGARPLMKSRSTNQPNMRRLLDSISGPRPSLEPAAAAPQRQYQPAG